MFPTKKDSDSIPVPLASFTGRDPFARKLFLAHFVFYLPKAKNTPMPPTLQMSQTCG